MTEDRGHALLDRLVGVDLLSQTGSFHGSDAARRVGTWAEALRTSETDQWKNLRIEFANRLSVSVRSVSVDLYQSWNNVAKPLRVRLRELIDRQVSEWLRQRQLPKEVLFHLQWDLLHAAMEAHYSFVIPPGMFSKMFELYLEGFFPCGWEGTWPSGMLLVL
jgi:hypothetical protein